ncbi:MAG: 2-dehydropantoate 2-reductase [Clostridia bacterium]|nr:2-dehydropantoate 2-reductase [Clostridia bacterium]
MKIAMIGSGAAGSVFASYLRKGGADMTLVDPYKEHMDKIAKDGMKFTIYPNDTYHLTGFKTAYTADDIGIMDIVIFMTKATHLESAIEGAKPCIGPNTVLVSLINGLGNDDKLLKYYPANRCMIGSGVIGTALDGPGGCISTPSEGVIMNFGAIENSDLNTAAGKHLEDCYNKGGCEAVFREDVLPFLWKKIVVNSTVNTVCAVLRLKIAEVEADPYGQKLFHDVIRECCAIANAKGVALDVEDFIANEHKHIVEKVGDYYPSMAQDVLWKKYRTEIDTLNGAISDYGKQFGIPTPTCDVLSTVIRCIQNNYAIQYVDGSHK